MENTFVQHGGELHEVSDLAKQTGDDVANEDFHRDASDGEDHSGGKTDSEANSEPKKNPGGWSKLGYGWVQEGTAARGRPLRDIVMMRMIDAITDKPRWREKIQDETIRAKWRQEFLEATALPDVVSISEGMVKRVFDELLFDAAGTRSEGIPIDPSFIGVCKTDGVVSECELQALRDGVRKLEDVPERAKDWHPNSDDKVLDLVHPSLFPLIAGRSRVLPEVVDDDNDDTIPDMITMLNRSGGGKVLERWKVDAEWARLNPLLLDRGTPLLIDPVSERYQWLPADVRLDHESGRLRTRFRSIINNLHPIEHRPLYNAIEAILARCVPLWDRVLADTRDDFATDQVLVSGRQRYYTSLRCQRFDPYEWYEDEPDVDASREEREEWYEYRVPVQPEAEPFVIPKEEPTPPGIVSSRSRFQVIVKLANIELGPGKERYEGGSWHVEGQLNERIRASAIYYYDEHNMTPSRLAFRQMTEHLEAYEQNDSTGMMAVFGLDETMPLLQELGSVATRPGRLLAFSNMFQHKVQPFELVDQTKRGWRKILAFFLVDPTLRITSTATVPPQQQEWWKPLVMRVPPFANLPVEMCELIFSFVDFPMTLETAKEERLTLMAERSVKTEDFNDALEENLYNLCEH